MAAARPAARPAPRPAPAAAAPTSDFDWTDLSADLGAAAPAAPQYAAAAPAAHWAGHAPPAPSPAGSFAAGPFSAGSFAAPKPARRKSSGGMSVVAKVLIGVGALFGGGVLLLVGLVVLGMFFAGRPQSKTTASLAGWSVDAPGRIAADKNAGGMQEKGILHRTTNSEFSIATKQVAQPGQSFTLEQIVEGMKRMGQARNVRPVQNGGLNGFRFELTARGATGTVEMFKIDDSRVLLLSYVPGTEKAGAGIGKARFNEAKTREMDDPEAFFASLRRG